MKSVLVLNILVILFALNVNSQPNKGVAGQIRIYEHEGFEGARQTINIPSTGCYNMYITWDDDISSIDPMNSCIVVYEGTSCTGRSVILDKNTRGRDRLSVLGMNDDISSMQLCSSA